MGDERLDDLDEYVVHSLQRDARKTSTSTIAEHADVSASTVRHRIRQLEEAGVIDGYHPSIDYERAGFQIVAGTNGELSEGAFASLSRGRSRVPAGVERRVRTRS